MRDFAVKKTDFGYQIFYEDKAMKVKWDNPLKELKGMHCISIEGELFDMIFGILDEELDTPLTGPERVDIAAQYMRMTKDEACSNN